jgi:release factor glutamine methyltransferase
VSLALTIAQLRQFTQAQFRALTVLDCDILLAHAIQKSRHFLYAHPEYVVDAAQQKVFFSQLGQRSYGEPVAYLIGQQEFWSLPFRVTKDTLIPRPDTETLVQLVLSRFGKDPLSLVDLGTGCGAIAIALQTERRSWNITAVELSLPAIAIAKSNARTLQCHEITFLTGSWFEPLANQCFDVIVSNPPYIAEDDIHIDPTVSSFEPARALFSGQNGLADMTHIIKNSTRFLLPNGLLAVEHGWQQAESVRDIFQRCGYAEIMSHTDLSGINRVTSGSFPPI